MAGQFYCGWVRFSLEVRDERGRVAYVDPEEWADETRDWMSGTDSMRQSMCIFRDRYSVPLPSIDAAVTLRDGTTGTIVRHDREEGTPVAILSGTGGHEGELHAITVADLAR